MRRAFALLLFAAAPLIAQSAGPYARIAVMRPYDGQSVDAEEGYVRHLEWHRQAKDPFTWYTWSIWAADGRQRWLIYATFGHSAAELSNPVSPADDERDTRINVIPHMQLLSNAVYEFLPALSRGSGVPAATIRAEYTIVDLHPGAATAFEAAIAAEQPKLKEETLWYRMIAGGAIPRYLRLRPRATLGAILDERAGLPEKVNMLTNSVTVEILSLRTNMLVNVTPEPPQ
jgi:hypothetical protein